MDSTRLLIAIILFFYAAFLHGQDALTLDQALDVALQNQYQIQIAEREADIANLDNNWGTAGRLPRVNLSVTNNNSYNKLNNPASFFTEASSLSTGLNARVDINWTLYNGAQVRLTKDQLESFQILNQNGVRQAMENTMAEVTRAYYTVQIRSEQLSVLEELLQLSADQLEYIQYQQDYGQAVLFDRLQAKDAYLNDSTNLTMQLSSYRTSFYNLNRTMGIEELNRTYRLADSLDRTIRSYTFDKLYNEAQGRNVNLDNMRLMREIAALNTRLAKASQYPRLDLNAGSFYNTDISNTDATFADGNMREFTGAKSNTFNTFLNLSATMNIFNGGNASRAVEKARIEELIAQDEVQDLKLDIKQGLRIAIENYDQFAQLYGIAVELAENAATNLEISKDRFRNGLINSFDFRSVQLSYLNARLQELNYLYNLRLAELDLLQLSGQLIEED